MLQEKLSNTGTSPNYLTIMLTNEEKKPIKESTFTFSQNDTIKTIVEKLNGLHFKIGQGIRFNYNYEDKSLVKISGFVENEVGCLADGVDKKLLNVSTFMIGQNRLEKQEDKR